MVAADKGSLRGFAMRGIALCALAISMDTPARDGDVMAPGVARVVSFDLSGSLRVRIVDHEYAGRWESTRPDALKALPKYWRGSRASLRLATVARAQLTGRQAAVLTCEFVIAEGRADGVCDDSSRVYYLLP